MPKVFFFSVTQPLIKPLDDYISSLGSDYQLSGLLSVSRKHSPCLPTHLRTLYLHDIYLNNYPSEYYCPPPSDFWEFVSSRELTLCRTISRFINVPSYSDQQYLLNLYASFWYSFFSSNSFDLFFFPSTPHRGIDNVAFEILLYLKKKVLLITEFHESGYLLLSQALIGKPQFVFNVNDANYKYLSDSYRSMAHNFQKVDSSARFTPRFTGPTKSKIQLITALFLPLVKSALLGISSFIRQPLSALFESNPPSFCRYTLTSSYKVVQVSLTQFMRQQFAAKLKQFFVVLKLLLCSRYSEPTSDDLVLCLSSAPEASIYPQQSLLGMPSTQCMWLRLLFPSKRILVKYHPRVFNPRVTEFSWFGYSYERSLSRFSNISLLDICRPIETLPSGASVISGVGSSSALMAARDFDSFQMVYSHFAYLLPELKIIPLEKFNYSPHPIASDYPTILTNCTLYTFLRSRLDSSNTLGHNYLIKTLLGDPAMLRKSLAHLLQK